MPDPHPLQGKVAIVTGAGGGIGRAYARGLADAGAAVVLADIAIDAAGSAATELEADGFAALAVAVDVTDEASVEAMAQAAVERFGSIDILVNNAGLVYLCSSASDWVTGHTLNNNHGWIPRV